MMQLDNQVWCERLPSTTEVEVTAYSPFSDDDVETLEKRLLEQLQAGNKQLLFPIGQFYFDQGRYDKAIHYFEVALSTNNDWQAMFQLGVMYYDGIGCETNTKTGFEYMLKVASSECSRAKHLIRPAQCLVGRAYYQGHGVRRSNKEAEKYWLMAADDGNPHASVKAQSILGLFYSTQDTLDLKKSFYWHTEACGNGNLESQGALGIMYNEGLGIKQNLDKALICFKDAASRGNVYAMGQLVAYYYQRKLFAKSVELGASISQFDDVAKIAKDTDCMELYIKKGIAMACFYYALCLSTGRGIQLDKEKAKAYFSRSFQYDPDTCARLQSAVQIGQI